MHAPRISELLQPPLAIMALLPLVLGSFRLFGDHIYNCRAEATAIRFRLFGFFPLWKISYQQTADVQRVTYRRALALRPFPFSFISRPGAQLIVIHRNRGLFKNVIVTPRDPDQLVGGHRHIRRFQDWSLNADPGVAVTSSFTYDANSLVNSLTTSPYNFAIGGYAGWRGGVFATNATSAFSNMTT